MMKQNKTMRIHKTNHFLQNKVLLVPFILFAKFFSIFHLFIICNREAATVR